MLVFDSGIGGLTIAEALRGASPGLTVDYAADTSFFPYGDKSDEALRARLPEVARAVCAASRPDVFVIACNTASTLALDEVRAALGVPVVGTVPAVKPAAARSRSGVIGLLATPGTIRRAYTDRLIADHASGVHVIKHGSIRLVRLAEAAAAGEAVDLDAIAAEQAPIFEASHGDEVDTIVLACTHFPLLRHALAETAPRAVDYIDSGDAIARRTIEVLTPSAPPRPPMGFVTSDDAGEVRRVLARFGYTDVSAVTAGLKGTTSPEAV